MRRRVTSQISQEMNPLSWLPHLLIKTRTDISLLKVWYDALRAEDRIVIEIETTSPDEIVFTSSADYCCFSWDFFQKTDQPLVFYLLFYASNWIILVGL